MKILREPLLEVLGMLGRLGGRDTDEIKTNVTGPRFDLPGNPGAFRGFSTILLAGL